PTTDTFRIRLGAASDGSVTADAVFLLPVQGALGGPVLGDRIDLPITSAGGGNGGPAWVALGDLDGDGELDIVTANKYAENLSVILSRGNGKYDRHFELDMGGHHTRSVAVADVDNDGDLDIVACQHVPAAVEVFLNDGHGHFAPRKETIVTS